MFWCLMFVVGDLLFVAFGACRLLVVGDCCLLLVGFWLLVVVR